MRTVIQTTPTQRKLLADIKKLFGEKGYLALGLAGPFRAHRDDFAAVPRNNPYGLFVVRYAKDYYVTITPYGIIAANSGMTGVIAKSKIVRDGRWRFTEQLLKERQEIPWQNILSAEGLKKFKKLVPEYESKKK